MTQTPKYAIMVKFEDSWMYVSEGTGEFASVITYDDKEIADNIADSWRSAGKEHNVKVVTYEG